MTSRIFLAALFLCFTACSFREVRDNEGSVCATVEGAEHEFWFWELPRTLAADAPVQLRYFTRGCLSWSCDTERESTCTMTIDGNVVTVESHAEWTAEGGPGVECTADCGRITTLCGSLPLGEGTWTIRHGADTLTLTIPSEHDRAPCT